MFRCYLCLLWYPSIDDLMFHLQNQHTLHVWSTLVCAQEGCSRSFDTFRSFVKHLKTKHNAPRDVIPLPEDGDNNLNIDGNAADENLDNNLVNNGNLNNLDNFLYDDANDGFVNDDNDNINENDPEVVTLENFIEATSKNAEMFAAYLYSIPTLNRKNVELIIAGISDFLGFGLVRGLKQKVVAVLDDECTCDNINPNTVFDIKGMFDVLEKPFEFLSSEFKRFKTLSDAGKFIQPESHVLNYENQFVRDGCDVDLEQKTVCVQVVPLRKSLQVFLQVPGMYQRMIDHVNSLNFESDIVKDFLQGELWQEMLKKFEGKTVYPLFLHFDDYEPDNPLGSHAGDDLLGALYASIASLPSDLRSAALNMFLVELFKANERKVAGNAKTFESVIDELEYLEKEGISLDLPTGEITIYFVLCLIVGDNKGINSIHGFVESFRAFFYCRICRIHRDVAAYTLSTVPALRRTTENYEVDVGTNDFTQTGVKEVCAFDRVTSYSVCKNIFVDLLHDVCEGMLRYGFGAILNELICNRDYFDLVTFHERIDGFNYGPSELGNKPPISHITIERIRNNNVKLSGSEALCLARYFGEIIGDLVPADNLAWRYYLIVREIVEIVTAPYFVKGTEDYLGILIREHHELYMQLAGSLKPKHHLMTHYPEVMKRNGPLPSYSALALERKHRQGKMYARVTNSRINLPLSVAVKVQLEFCHHVMTFDPHITYKTMLKINYVRASSLNGFNLYRGVLPFTPNQVVSVTKGVNVLGTNYKVNMVVVLNAYDLFPVFCKIVMIFITNNGPMFLCKKMLTEGYINKLCSFLVQDENEYLYICQNEFASYMPLWQRTSQDGKQVVSVRHAL